ncbi:MAG: cyclodeaminase/cyclohydrolase family protein [Planctomycetes bacterium]|nr:cyclodeaminase/cyclohydrolase family protein [Planctomycetota bacterium]
MYRHEPLEKYLREAASGSPTPGGGSVSALVGALGTTMACMAANFTVGREKFKAVEPRVRELLAECDASWDKLVNLMQADTEAYAKVSAAYGMPKATAAEKAARTAAIQEALKIALSVPLDAVRASQRVLTLVRELVDLANPNLISDVGVAAILVEAALAGAKLNVDINLAGLKDTQFVAQVRAEVDGAAAFAADTRRAVMEKVEKAIQR